MRSTRLRNQLPFIFLHMACCLIVFAMVVIMATPTFAMAGPPPTIVAGTSGKALPQTEMGSSPFTIAILPDRTTGRPWGIPYLDRAIDELNIIKPDVVFTVGDMVQGYTRSASAYRREVEEYQGIAGRLTSPFFPLPGNHDVISGHRDPDDHQFESLYQEHFGPLYYAAQFDHATVIALHTDEALASSISLSETQTTWIVEQIKAAASRQHTIVMMMHKPAWRYRNSNWDVVQDALAKAAKEHNLGAVVVAGHFHSLQRDPDLDGVQYHLVGTCGAMIDQHPLTGQFQHLTFLKIFPDTGATSLYHTPVGVTLPDDFVVAADQRRAFLLKSRSEVCTIDNVLPQPIEYPVDEKLHVTIHNPLERDVVFAPRLAKHAPEVSVVDGYGFFGRTQQDIFNPHVTNIDTPFEFANQVTPFVLEPGESRQLEILTRCPLQGHMIAPPELHVVATFIDDQGRDVPVIIRRRVPLTMQYRVTDSLALRMPLSAWTFSVYDRRERDPLMGISASAGTLNIALAVFDDIVCFESTDDPTTRVSNPESDSVVISFGQGNELQQFLIEAMSPDHQALRILEDPENSTDRRTAYTLEPAPEITFELEQRDQGFGMFIQLPLEWLGRPNEIIPFNVRIADNDETYHTQWRQWAPNSADCTIVLPSTFD